MPTLPHVLAKLSLLTTTPAIIGLVVTASLIVIARDWRLSLAALAVQYVLVGLLLTRLIQPHVAVIKVLIGALVCIILYLTARLAGGSGDELRSEEGAAEDNPSGHPMPRRDALLSNSAFRLLATMFVGLAVYGLSRRYHLPELPLDIGFACYLLGSMGLLVVMLTEQPLKAGMGLLTIVAGFELFYSPLERSLSVAGFLGIANLLIGLAIAYLAASRAEPTPQEREG